jgi:predicted ATPase/signal transduction histidine kinase
LDICGYTISERVSESPRSSIFRGVRLDTGQKAILKLPASNGPSAAQTNQIKHEFSILSRFRHNKIVSLIGLGQHGHLPVLIEEDFDGLPLSTLNREGPGDLLRFLDIAIQLADALRDIHRQKIIYKNLCPAHILFRSITGRIKLIDFSIASLRDKEYPFHSTGYQAQGALAYISPEQTGRINKQLDYRSDFYSLGVVLYELLTGSRPFTGTDLIEQVHSHLAKAPIPPQAFNPDIPDTLSAIVLKLIEKSADDRYQSCSGLIPDLMRCLIELRESRSIIDFGVGRDDISPVFSIPTRHVGRNRELERLVGSYDTIDTGANRAYLITGESGSGKTQLLQETRKALEARGAIVLFATADNDQETAPGAPMIMAFRRLVRRLLSVDTGQRASWQDVFRRALGEQVRVAINLIPELEFLLGAPPDETPNRQLCANPGHAIIQKLIDAIDHHCQTLIIIQDDLHRIDPETLTLITSFLKEPKRQGLLIGSSAAGEAAAAIFETIGRSTVAGSPLVHLELPPLTVDEIGSLLSETLYQPLHHMLPLARCCLEKTGGNPFFLKQFLNQLHEAGTICFNEESGRWDSDLQTIMATAVTPNVGVLLTRSIEAFPAGPRTVLQYAGCIGSRFDLTLLSTVYGKSRQQTLTELTKALVSGLVIPASPCCWQDAAVEDTADQQPEYYRFAHDQVRQAALALLPFETRSLIQVRIGTVMRHLVESTNRSYPITEIVSHLNHGIHTLDTKKQRLELAALNLAAAAQAKIAGSVAHYRRFTATALELLPPTAWSSHYSLALDVHSEAAVAAARSLLVEENERLFAIVCAQARSGIDKTRVYLTRMALCRQTDRFAEALQAGRAILSELGISLPDHPRKGAPLAMLFATRLHLLGTSRDALLRVPRMTDAKQISIMEVLLETALAAYRTRPVLLPIIGLTAIRLSLTYGYHAVSSIIGYPVYAALLCSMSDRKRRIGYRYGQLALDLQNQRGTDSHPLSIYLINTLIVHWHHHLGTSLDPLQNACQLSLNRDEPEFAALCTVGCSIRMFFLGRKLSSVLDESARNRHHIDESPISGSRYCQMILEQTIANLDGRSGNPSVLNGSCYDGNRLPLLHQRSQDRATLFFYHLLGQLLAYLFGSYERAEEHGLHALALSDTAWSSFLLPLLHFTHTLTLLALCRDPTRNGRRNRMTAIGSSIKKMRCWARSAPENYRHRYHLLSAELSRIQGQHEAAAHHFELAISQAKRHGYQQEAALSYELAASFYCSIDRPLVARPYLAEALHHYRHWGATALVGHLAGQYRDLLVERRMAVRDSEFLPLAKAASSDGRTLDLSSFIKASRAFSGEFVLEEVVRKLIMIIVENAGAEIGFLIMNPADSPMIKVAAAGGDRQGTVVDTPLPAQQHRLSLAVINYVTRSGKTVVLDHACADGPFTGDRHIRDNNTKSLLCVPIKHHGDLLAIVYLENNLTTSAFSPERLDILELIAGQAAISIKNAQLYEELQATLTSLHREVAKRKETQMQLLHAGKLAALGRLSASIAHEFGNPLIGIKYLLDDLSQRNELGRQDRTLIEIGLQECDRLKNLINDLHELHRPSSGKKRLFNLNDTVTNVLHLQRKNLKHAGIEVITRLADDLPEIRAVEDQVSQVIVNLTTNAMDAMKQSGTRQLQVNTFTRDQRVFLAVIDNGCGIAIEHREQIFEPFFSTKPYTDGTGLGLAIAYSIMKHHRGDIGFSSTPGNGSEFILSFPLNEHLDSPLQPDRLLPVQ